MLIVPELAVALRHELKEAVAHNESEAVQLSVWRKVRPERAQRQVAVLRAALEQGMDLVLWQKGLWADATAARKAIGGEFADASDMETLGQLWLFDAVALPASVKQRFDLPADARLLGRILLAAPVSESAGAAGTALGYLFRSAPAPRSRDGFPFLRLLPDLYPGEFLMDPHINFVAARRFVSEHARDVTPFGRTCAGRILTVGPSDFPL